MIKIKWYGKMVWKVVWLTLIAAADPRVLRFSVDGPREGPPEGVRPESRSAAVGLLRLQISKVRSARMLAGLRVNGNEGGVNTSKYK